MRLLFFSNVLPSPVHPTRGPFNASMLNALARQHSVTAVCPISMLDRISAQARTLRSRLNGKAQSQATRSAQQSRAAFHTADGPPAIDLHYPTFYYPPKVLRDWYGDFLDWSVGRLVARLIREQQIEAVLSYWVHPDGDVAVRHARRDGIPSVAMTGGSDILLLARSGRRRRVMLKVLHDADAIVTVSTHLKDQLIQDGLPEQKITVIPRGIDRARFSISSPTQHDGSIVPADRITARTAARERLQLDPQRPLLLGVGRLVPVKGWELLIEACAQLQQAGTNVQCHLIGSGPLEAKLRAQLQQHNLLDTVTLHRARPQAELADWYRAADLSVLTSHSEGIPNVLLESIACGTPFVATNVGGVAEIADPIHDRLVSRRDPLEFARAVQQALELHREPLTLPRAWEPLSWTESADRLTRLLENCQRLHHPDSHAARQITQTGHTDPLPSGLPCTSTSGQGSVPGIFHT